MIQLTPDEDVAEPTATAQIPIKLLLALKVIALVSTFVLGVTHWLVPASQRIRTRLAALPLALLKSSEVYLTIMVASLASRPVRPLTWKQLPVKVKPVGATGNWAAA